MYVVFKILTQAISKKLIKDLYGFIEVCTVILKRHIIHWTNLYNTFLLILFHCKFKKKNQTAIAPKIFMMRLFLCNFTIAISLFSCIRKIFHIINLCIKLFFAHYELLFLLLKYIERFTWNCIATTCLKLFLTFLTFLTFFLHFIQRVKMYYFFISRSIIRKFYNFVF